MGLEPADVAFDQGDVWMTPWIETVRSLGPISIHDAVLELLVVDVGDSTWDTAVLIDDIALLP